MKAAKYLLPTVLLMVAGCATGPRVQLHSVETKSQRTAEELSQSRIAILPIAIRIGSQQVLAPLRKGQEVFLQHTIPADKLIAGQDVHRLLAANQTLAQTYQRLVQELIDFDPALFPDKDDILGVVDPIPWTGDKGIKYENIRVVCDDNRYRWSGYKPVLASGSEERTASSPVRGKDIQLQWNLRTKSTTTNRMIAPASSRELAQALHCDYLLVPVVHDMYYYLRSWFFLIMIPLPITPTTVTPNHELALYLIDGKTGELVRSIQIGEATLKAPFYTGGVLSMAAAFQQILGRGDFMGRITPLKE